MRILKRALLALGAAVVLLAGIGLLLPSSYSVERSVTIQASPEEVFNHLQTLKGWPEWTAWTVQRYPDMKVSFSGPDQGVGAVYVWNGEEVGAGSLKLTGADPSRGVTYDLDFDNGQFLSKGEIRMEPAGDQVKLTWINRGDLGWNPINRYFGLMIDGVMGPDFETGLNNLKNKLEKK
jgi:hypothetical protein